MIRIASLDLSLRGAGMVALPLDWGGDWSRLARHTYGEKLPVGAPEQLTIGRLMRIAAEVIAFVRQHRCATVTIEQYAFSRVGAARLGEVGGAVKVALVERLGIVPRTFFPQSARKLLLGKLPRADVKPAVRAALTGMGMPPEWTADEADAFVGANYTASELGGFAFAALPPAPPRGRPPKRKRAA